MNSHLNGDTVTPNAKQWKLMLFDNCVSFQEWKRSNFLQIFSLEIMAHICDSVSFVIESQIGTRKLIKCIAGGVVFQYLKT